MWITITSSVDNIFQGSAIGKALKRLVGCLKRSIVKICKDGIFVAYVTDEGSGSTTIEPCSINHWRKT